MGILLINNVVGDMIAFCSFKSSMMLLQVQSSSSVLACCYILIMKKKKSPHPVPDFFIQAHYMHLYSVSLWFFFSFPLSSVNHIT